MKKLLFLLLVFLFGSNHLFAQSKLTDLVEEGVKLHDEGKYEEAIEKYSEALKIDKKSSLVNYEMGYSYYALKEYDKAIKYLNKVIKKNTTHVKDAYIVKGSALDYDKKAKEAIKVYEEAIEKFPDEYLLYFNLALTQYQNGYKEYVEDNLIQAIALNPSHPTSNFLLGLVKADEGRRVESLLALYFFLLLEPNSSRSEGALTQIDRLMNQGVSQKNDQNIEIQIDAGSLNDDFSSTNLIMSLMAARNSSDENKDKSEEQLFYENTETILSTLVEKREGKEEIWWTLYVDFYASVIEAGHLEALCYYITQAKGAPVQQWIEENEDKMNAFVEWMNNG